MNAEQEKEFREKCQKDCEKMTFDNNVKWATLSLFLENEFSEGKTDFRLHINEDKTFYIHPVGKDGQTLDGVIF